MSNQHKRKFKYTGARIVALLFVAITVPSANAQSINPSLDDIIQLRFGPLFASFQTTVTVAGLPFDQEQLDDSKTTAAGNVRWRITPKLHLNVAYSQISNDDTTTLSSSTNIGGISVPGGTILSQDYKTSSLPLVL